MQKIGCLECNDPILRRRDFLRVGSLSLLGVSLSQLLRLRSTLAAGPAVGKAKAQACILLWLEGGPSQIDMWDPKPNSSFMPIATNVAGIQVSELLPKVAKRMDKLAIIRSMHTLENNHPQATHYAATGHQPNPAMRFPSLGSIVAKELGPRNNLPPYVLQPDTGNDTFFVDHFGAAFVGNQYDPMVLPDPSQPGFEVPDLRLPKSITPERLQDRLSFQKVVGANVPQQGAESRIGWDGPIHRAGPEDGAESGREGCLRSFQGVHQDEGDLRAARIWAKCPAGPALGGGGEPFCDGRGV